MAWQPTFPNSTITEEQEAMLWDFFFSGYQSPKGKRPRQIDQRLPGSEPEIRKAPDRRKPNVLEKTFLERGLS